MDETENQIQNTKPWLWKKGQSGNVMGRPKGKTMKEYARQYLERMTDEERDEWLEGLPKDIIWKMSEGNPDTKSDVTSGGQPIIIQVAHEVANKHNLDTAQSTVTDSK